MEPLLQVQNLKVTLGEGPDSAPILRGVDLDVRKGEHVALVGESGCGKSVTALSILHLLPDPPMRRTSGELLFKGRDLAGASSEEWRRIRGREIGIIFQEPLSSLNPVFKAGDQVDEALRAHEPVGPAEARVRTLGLFRDVGLADPVRVADQYPHQLSGGMCQRVMIAMALSGRPSLLIADEPTTALDVTVQAQILELIAKLSRDLHMSVLFITHDLSLVRDRADRVVILYAGLVMEEGSPAALFSRPRHPYTHGLLACQPALARGREPLATLAGSVPGPRDVFPGCPFAPRCPRAGEKCSMKLPSLERDAEQNGVRCYYPH